METAKDFLEMYYGHENQRKKLSNGMELVEIHIAEWVSEDENWEEGDWFIEGNGKSEHIARCNGYEGVEWLSGLYDIVAEDEDLEEEIKELVEPYNLQGLELEARDSSLRDAEDGDTDVIIMVEHYYFTNDVNSSFKNAPKPICNADGSDRIFETFADAKNFIEAKESQTYYLAHGEAGRPSYRIVRQ